uniref:GOLD domain-containing protein n=1 Tax=Globodera pallida TaxID=36090 RepID=A0A183CIS5_GLOPA
MLAQQNTSFTPPTTSAFSFVEQNEEEIVMAVVVEAGRLDCVYQTIAAPKFQSFEVVKGGEHDITFSVKSPAGFMIANDQRKSDGTHRFVLDEPQHGRGDYALCFDNTFSYTNSKRVFFEIYLLDKDGNYLSDNDLKVIQRKDGLLEEHFEVFNRVTTKVKGNLNEIERVQAQFRAIEARDRFIMETAFERINFWSLVHLFCLLFAAGVQVFMLRSLFIDDSLVGRFVGKFN